MAYTVNRIRTSTACCTIKSARLQRAHTPTNPSRSTHARSQGFSGKCWTGSLVVLLVRSSRKAALIRVGMPNVDFCCAPSSETVANRALRRASVALSVGVGIASVAQSVHQQKTRCQQVLGYTCTVTSAWPVCHRRTRRGVRFTLSSYCTSQHTLWLHRHSETTRPPGCVANSAIIDTGYCRLTILNHPSSRHTRGAVVGLVSEPAA